LAELLLLVRWYITIGVGGIFKPTASADSKLLNQITDVKEITIVSFLVLSFTLQRISLTTIQTASRFSKTDLFIINLFSSFNPELYEIYRSAVINLNFIIKKKKQVSVSMEDESRIKEIKLDQ
jgi:hypothetical protein